MGILVQERCLVDQHIAALRRRGECLARGCVARQNNRSTLSCWPKNLTWLNVSNCLSALQSAEIGPRLKAKRCSALQVNPSGSVGFAYGVAERRASMCDVEGANRKTFEIHALIVIQLAADHLVTRASDCILNQVEH
jgi:hypothetical protein